MSRASKRISRRPPAFLPIDKPSGMTSHDVVQRVRRILGERRVGHAGTLDPDATGVLAVGIGVANRLFEYFADIKIYEATVRFGATTDTLDAAGTVTNTFPMSFEADDVAAVFPTFLGTIAQVPPMVSALKVAGKPLHAYAREGITLDRPARNVRVDSIVMHSFRSGPPIEADLEVTCGGGTYIRSLAADLGSALGGGAHLAALRRTRVGPFDSDASVTLEQFEADPEGALIDIPTALGWPHITLESGTPLAVQVGNGMRFDVTTVPEWGTGPMVAVEVDSRLSAIYQLEDSVWRCVVGVPKATD